MYIRWRPHAWPRWVSASLLPSLYFHSLFSPFIHPKRMLFESSSNQWIESLAAYSRHPVRPRRPMHKQESICRRLRERLLLARPRWVFLGKSDVVPAELAATADASADVTYLDADGARRRSLHGRAVLQEGKEDRRLRS